MPNSRPDSLQALAVDLLATLDAAFTPFRHDSDGGAAIFERRRGYPQHGLSIVGGGDVAARQRHFRTVGRLRDAGMITLAGSGKGRGLKFTPWGEARLRALCATFTVRHFRSWTMLQLVAELTDDSGHRHVLENDLLAADRSHRATSSELAMLELYATPLLVAGLLDSQADCRRHVGYHLTPAGQAALRDGPPPDPDPDAPPCDDALCALYDQRFAAALRDRKRWTPTRPGPDLAIPLSAGLWREPTYTPEALDLLAALHAPIEQQPA
jgi:hypothetical protein